jgi:hypothetical protein
MVCADVHDVLWREAPPLQHGKEEPQNGRVASRFGALFPSCQEKLERAASCCLKAIEPREPLISWATRKAPLGKAGLVEEKSQLRLILPLYHKPQKKSPGVYPMLLE